VIHETVTPSGITIAFEDGEPDGDGQRKRRSYKAGLDGDLKQYVSVTTVLGATIEKPGLRFAAEKLAVEGMLTLAQEGALAESVERNMAALKERELLHWQRWAVKAARGTLAHEDLVRLATGAPLPELSTYAPDEQGFMRGVADFYAEARPQVLHSELCVASLEHGYAGRLDLLCRTHLHPGVLLLDLKTTSEIPRDKKARLKAPYGENVAQLDGYRTAAIECGYEAPDALGVLRVEASGGWDLYITHPRETFPVFVKAYQALKALP
jgi:hypothetical protein